MRRGDLWIAAAGSGYLGKPRPVLILQDDRFSETGSVTVCPLTTNPTPAPLFRIELVPGSDNGLQERSRLMVDKITTVSRERLDKKIGFLDDATLLAVNRAVIVFLGIAQFR